MTEPALDTDAGALRTMRTATVIGIFLAWQAVCSRLSTGCLSLMKPCISADFCRNEQALLGNICDSEAPEDPPVKAEWEKSKLSGYVPGPNTSCLQEMMMCIQDEVCNRHLVPFIQSCSDPYCEDSRCRLATGHFFSGLPQNVAEMLVFCPCESLDQDCQDVRATLHSSSCSGGQTLPWNCLEMLDICSGVELCRQTFGLFLSKCFGPEDMAPFNGYSTRDLLQVIDFEFFRSGDKECRKAFVSTMGSVLHSPCTCHGLHHDDLYRCNMLQQAIQNRTHFRLQEPKRNVSSTPSQANKSTQQHLWLNGQLWFFMVYIFLVVGILITVAFAYHKLGGIHNMSKNPTLIQQEDSTKSLVL